MKKNLLASTILLAVSASSFAQYDEEGAYVQGQSSISAGYGFGNIWKKLFTLAATYSDGAYKVTSTGPFSLTYEYGLSEKISGGIAVSYAQVKAANTDEEPTLSYKETLTNFSVIARGNYHFGNSEKFDPYIGIGLGYYKFKYEYKDGKGNTDNNSFAVPGALGFNGQLGIKYYLTPKIGAFAEVGYVVGGLGQIGLTARF